jgi:hypothetical protein
MTKSETVLTAGKRIAAIASGRAYKPESEDLLDDSSVERQREPSTPTVGPSATKSKPAKTSDSDRDEQ